MSSEQFRTGLVAVTNASQIVIGTASCDWRNQIEAAHVFKVDRSGEVTYAIATVLTATRLLLSANYAGTTGTGLDYIVARSFTLNRGFWRPLSGDSDWAEIMSQETIDKIDTDIDNIISGNASLDGTREMSFGINTDDNCARLSASFLTASRLYRLPDQNATLVGLNVPQIFSEDQTINASLWVTGNASLDGTLDVGGIGTIPTINLTGGQIAFPATAVPSADPNTLDDYEEGEWTFDLQFGGAKVDITYDASYNTGRYVKIGRFVHCVGVMVLTSKGSSNGNATIAGLPFICANENAAYAASHMRFANISFADFFQASVVKNTALIALEEITNAGVQTTLTDANFANNSLIAFNILYGV